MTKRILSKQLDLIPTQASLEGLREAAKSCKNCNLWKLGTQTVFGEGAQHSKLMLVGEQPGDQEDLAGKPFVGPAGKLLDTALVEAGIDRKKVYVTNAVKHFKWEPRGKRRIHKKPNAAEIAACRPWLDSEITAIRPKVIVCLGATAAQVLLGKDFRVTQHRGEFIESAIAPYVAATVHPSSILRAPMKMLAMKKWPASSPTSRRSPAFCNDRLNYFPWLTQEKCASASPGGPTNPGAAFFYPKDLKQKHELEYASKTFNSIEINGTFYSLQRPTSFERWAAETPDDFVFSVKAPRFITHIKRLKDAKAPIANFLASGILI